MATLSFLGVMRLLPFSINLFECPEILSNIKVNDYTIPTQFIKNLIEYIYIYIKGF